MKRILFAVGCNAYADLPTLKGCEIDADGIFRSLLDPQFGGYDQDESILLLSPTLAEVRETFDKLVRHNANVLTFSFAGHGGVKTGNLYLCLKDSTLDRLSTTALPVTEIFTILSEAAPRQANIIIDACQAGGVVFDLKRLISPDLLGAAGTPSVSILASAAMDQFAGEGTDGGYVSSAVVRCLNGQSRVQSTKPFLDLIEVGRFVAQEMSKVIPNQSPVVWGLNISGEPYLAMNPHFEEGKIPYSYNLAQIPAASQAGKVLQKESNDLWGVYQTLSEAIEPRRVIDAIQRPCHQLTGQKGALSAFVKGLSRSVPPRAAEQLNLMAEAEALGCCICSLLPFIGIEPDVEETILELSIRQTNLLGVSLANTCQKMEEDRYALLSTKGGVADLFILPIRISTVAGWAAAYSFLCRECSGDVDGGRELLLKICGLLQKDYSESIVSISDCQSSYLLVLLMELKRHNQIEVYEATFGYMFNDYIRNRGYVADVHIEPDKVPDFLLRRASQDVKGARRMYAQPDELLSVLLYAAAAAGLDDVVDPFLEDIDHHSFNVFIPSDHRTFTSALMREGTNATFHVGLEGGLGVFRTSDFRAGWDLACKPILGAERMRESKAIKIATLMAALLLPDRVPWLACCTSSAQTSREGDLWLTQ